MPIQYTNMSIPTSNDKRAMFGMVLCLDEALGNITAKLQSNGMWDNTLLVFSADNGGEIGGAGNNYPLRGKCPVL